MTEAMPFLQKTILLSYDPRPFAAGFLFVILVPEDQPPISIARMMPSLI